MKHLIDILDLSREEIEKLIEERMPKYRGWSDITIHCVNAYENAKMIIKELKL